MRCSRLAHAGLLIEHGDATLVVDPGNFTTHTDLAAALAVRPPVAAVVITHEHADHWTLENVGAIHQASPDAPVFTTAATAEALRAAGIDGAIETVREGDTQQVGPFALEFYGSRHEVLHASIPVIENVGVRVNKMLAWGGDSLVRPPFAADVLGVPIGSPWSNIAQVMDFVLHAAPRRAYLTHDGMLSPAGLGLFTQRVRWCLDQVGGALLELPHATSSGGAGQSL